VQGLYYSSREVGILQHSEGMSVDYCVPIGTTYHRCRRVSIGNCGGKDRWDGLFV